MEMFICAGCCFQVTFEFDGKQLFLEELIVYFSMEGFKLPVFFCFVHALARKSFQMINLQLYMPQTDRWVT